jgi:hypothetical protein
MGGDVAGRGAGLALPRTAAVLVLLVLAVVAAALAGPWSPQLGGLAPAALPTALPSAEDAVTDEQPDAGTDADAAVALPRLDRRPFVWLGVLVAFALAAWVTRVVLSRRQQGAPADEPAWQDLPDEPEPSTSVLRLGLEEAADGLRREGVPADAVVAAWVALERAASRSGVPRDPASTPTEFALEVLGRTSADRHAARSLLAAYERARFSDLPVTAADVERAGTDLRVLAATLRAGGAP